jgi:acetyltransferase-like isoleucine patch superfamily enzyme/2-polyprenyl-3-methyl-5-hydroxy-6-metoxy-1,4-benzoquinol methylase
VPAEVWHRQAEQRHLIDGHFEAVAPFWDDLYDRADVSTWLFRERQARALAWIDGLNLPRDARILDAGCGAGHAAIALARRGYHVDAIDPVAAMVELARRNAEEAGQRDRLEIRLGDIHALDAEPEQYDLVLALGVVPWLHSPGQALREVARVLKPAGHAIVTCDNRRGLVYLIDPMRGAWLEPARRTISGALRRAGLRRTPPHGPRAQFHRRRELDALLSQAGLRKLSWRTQGFGPFTVLGRQLPDAVGRPMLAQLQRLADRGVPGLRAGGSGYMVLAQKASADLAPKIHPTAEVSTAASVGTGTRIWNEVQVREGARIGDDCVLAKGVYIDIGVVVGNRVKLENRVSIFQGAILADGVFIGPHTCLLNDKLPRAITPEGALKRRADWQAQGVNVGTGASIGGGCTVLPGVRIGRFAMVGAGAIVTKDVPDFGLVVGNPARIVGYVCQCGARLSTSGECPTCGRQHDLKLGETDG